MSAVKVLGIIIKVLTIPAEMVLALPHGHSRHISIETDKLVLRVSSFDCLGFRQCWIKFNFQDLTFLGAQTSSDVNSMRKEHIVRLQDFASIESDMSKRVETVKG